MRRLTTVPTVVSQKQVNGKVRKFKTASPLICPLRLYSNGGTFCLRLSCSMSVGTAERVRAKLSDWLLNRVLVRSIVCS